MLRILISPLSLSFQSYVFHNRFRFFPSIDYQYLFQFSDSLFGSQILFLLDHLQYNGQMFIQCRPEVCRCHSSNTYQSGLSYFKFSIAAMKMALLEETRHFWSSCTFCLTRSARTVFSSTIPFGSKYRLISLK